MTKSYFTPDFGSDFGGGYFAGQINDGGTIYNIIVPPVTSGSLTGQTPSPLAWSDSSQISTVIDGQLNKVCGKGVTEKFISNYNTFYWPLFGWVLGSDGPNAGTYDATNTIGTGIGGFNDWYIPAEYEMNVTYYGLKPTTDVNQVGAGAIGSSAVAPMLSTGWTSNNPTQTSAGVFQGVNPQSYQPGGLQIYWTATAKTGSVTNAYYGEYQAGGTTTSDQGGFNKTRTLLARAVRREPA